MVFSRTVYINTLTPVELRPPMEGRALLEIITDASIAYFSEDTQATPENGRAIAANGVLTMSDDGQAPEAVPQGNCWLLGAAVAPALQKVIIREAPRCRSRSS